MKRLFAVAAILGMALVVVAPRTALGDTPTPTSSPTPTTTPTTTPTPSPTVTSTPTALDLINEMNSAVTAKNTVHEVITLTLKLKQNANNYVNETVKGKADESIKPVRLKEKLSGSATGKSKGKAKKQSIAETLILVGKHVAVQDNGGKWACSTAKGSLGSASSTGVSTSDISSASIVGTDTINNVAVWHVQVVIDSGSTGLSGSGLPSTVTEDVYIAQSDFTLVRLHVAFSGKASGLTLSEAITEDFSKYRETVNPKLPSACK